MSQTAVQKLEKVAQVVAGCRREKRAALQKQAVRQFLYGLSPGQRNALIGALLGAGVGGVRAARRTPETGYKGRRALAGAALGAAGGAALGGVARQATPVLGELVGQLRGGQPLTPAQQAIFRVAALGAAGGGAAGFVNANRGKTVRSTLGGAAVGGALGAYGASALEGEWRRRPDLSQPVEEAVG